MIIELSKLYNLISKTRNRQTTILVTGVFDLLHPAHIKFLKLSKNQGDILLVGLETDTRVKKLKGKNRPVENLETRLNNISKLSFVDYVFALPEKFNTKKDFDNFIAEIKPNVLAVSSHTPNLTIKKELIEKHGGQLNIVMIEDPQVSTTKILEK